MTLTLFLALRFSFNIPEGWNPESELNTSATHMYYVEASLPSGQMFGFIVNRPFMGGFMFPDIYMGSDQGYSIEYVRAPLPPTQPPPEPEPESTGNIVIVVVVVVVVVVVAAAVLGVVVYVKKTKLMRGRSVTPTKPIVDEEWSRVTPSPTQGSRKHEEAIIHF